MKKNVLVFVKDPLVCEDIVEIVREVHPTSEIVVAEDLQSARDSLKRGEGWAWAVVDLPQTADVKGELGRAMRASDALPVVIGDGVGDPDTSDWVFLDMPFNSAMLRAALERTFPR